MPTDNNLRIKIFTRSFSLELYRLSKELYKCFGWETVRLTDQTADGYFFTILKDRCCDIAINIDEDAFVVNPQAIKELVDIVVAGNYANAGGCDGGVEVLRGGNPIVTNPFFNVFNFKLIREKIDREKIGKQQIKNFKINDFLPQMIENFPKEILTKEAFFYSTDDEPYYPFFFWLSYNFKTLYLPLKRHHDGTTTIIHLPNGEEILYHSWFARFYNLPTFLVKMVQRPRSNQRERISKLIDEVYAIRGINRPQFGVIDNIAFVLNLIVRWGIKIPQRILNWPRKMVKKIKSKRKS